MVPSGAAVQPLQTARALPFRSGACDAMADHLFRIDDLIEALLVDEAGSERRLFQRQALVIGLVRDLGRLVVADYRAERRHQHQRAADHLVDTLAVEPRTVDREMPQLVA